MTFKIKPERTDGFDKPNSAPPRPASPFPEVTVNKNGYCIRTDLIKYAKDYLETEHTFKVGEWQSSAKIDKDGHYVYDVTYPKPPTIDDIVAAAEKFYQFVNKQSR